MTAYRLIMTPICLLCGLGAASSIWPAIDVVMTAVALGSLGLAAVIAAIRAAVGEVRLRREIRAAAPIPTRSRLEIHA